jgi:anti-sigma factor (TIGR02949 family)
MTQDRMAREAIDCAGAKERLFDLLDGELDDETVARMQRHIVQCQHCFDRSDFERRFLAAVHVVRTAGPMPGALRERVLAALRAEGWVG